MYAASTNDDLCCALLSFGSYHSFTFRVGATKSAPDLREHGHKTLSFLTIHISSKIGFSASASLCLNWTGAE